jgi:hypothetical protein
VLIETPDCRLRIGMRAGDRVLPHVAVPAVQLDAAIDERLARIEGVTKGRESAA